MIYQIPTAATPSTDSVPRALGTIALRTKTKGLEDRDSAYDASSESLVSDGFAEGKENVSLLTRFYGASKSYATWDNEEPKPQGGRILRGPHFARADRNVRRRQMDGERQIDPQTVTSFTATNGLRQDPITRGRKERRSSSASSVTTLDLEAEFQRIEAEDAIKRHQILEDHMDEIIGAPPPSLEFLEWARNRSAQLLPRVDTQAVHTGRWTTVKDMLKGGMRRLARRRGEGERSW